MATFAPTTNSEFQLTSDPQRVIPLLKEDRTLREEDLVAGRRVPALLIGVFATGLLMMAFTVLISLKS